MKSILDKGFVYKPSYETDVAKTIARAKRELAAELERAKQIEEEAQRVVTSIKKRAK